MKTKTLNFDSSVVLEKVENLDKEALVGLTTAFLATDFNMLLKTLEEIEEVKKCMSQLDPNDNTGMIIYKFQLMYGYNKVDMLIEKILQFNEEYMHADIDKEGFMGLQEFVSKKLSVLLDDISATHSAVRA